MIGSAALLLGLAAGCTYSHGDPAPCDISAETVTYAGVVAPIFEAHCLECHASSTAGTQGGSHDFSDYEGIHNYPARTLLGCIQHAPGFLPMPQGRPALSECDVLRIKAWIDAGEPKN